MKRLFPIFLVIGGCASTSPPIDVRLIPNDCANQHAIISWLDRESQRPKAPMESRENYELQKSQLKARLWHVRYNCNLR